MERRIPNFNTLSTLIDRLSIENVKLAHFENAVEHDQLTPQEVDEFEKRIAVQREIIEALKQQLVAFMEEVFCDGGYRYMKEERTFK